jgi:hypothetical protein
MTLCSQLALTQKAHTQRGLATHRQTQAWQHLTPCNHTCIRVCGHQCACMVICTCETSNVLTKNVCAQVGGNLTRSCVRESSIYEAYQDRLHYATCYLLPAACLSSSQNRANLYEPAAVHGRRVPCIPVNTHKHMHEKLSEVSVLVMSVGCALPIGGWSARILKTDNIAR